MKKMMMCLWALFAFSLGETLAQDSTQLAAWVSFNDRYDRKWTIRWDQDLSTPATIYGYRSAASSDITIGPEAVAKRFFDDNKKVFKLKGFAEDLSLDKQFHHGELHHLHFRQIYSGIPVYKGEYNVTMGDDGSLRMVSGRFLANIDIDVNPSITSDQAEEIAGQFLGISRLRQDPQTELVVFRRSNQVLLVFKVILLNEDPWGDWIALVDAKTGEIVDTEDVTVDVDGSGYAYPKDPVNSSLTTVTLPRLVGAGNYLEGSYVKVLNEDQARAYSPNAQFYYNPVDYHQLDNTHFDEVNLYYHIDRFMNHLVNDVGFPGLGRVIEAKCHYGYNLNNAFYDLNGTNNLFFGDGDRVRFYDFSKKEDVIYHELQHAVTHHYGIQYSGETAALHEGYSDYFTASYTQEPAIGEWHIIATNIGHLRNVGNDKNYFKYSNINVVQYCPNTVDGGYWNPAGSAHAKGMIWSGAVWDLRAQFGATITDFLTLKGMYYRNGYPTFLQAREGIIQADVDYYSGSHVSTIMNLLAVRGIGDPAPLSVTMSGPSVVFHPGKSQTNYYTWTANVSGGTSPFNFVWKKNGNPVGTNSSQYTEGFTFNGWNCDSYQITYRVDVTDAAQGSVYATKNVTAWNSCGGEWAAAPGVEPVMALPMEFSVQQNYPNPFNPETEISFALPERSSVKITISDVLGRQILTLADRDYSAGYQRVTWKGTDALGNKVSSGVYFYRITATGESGKQFTKVMKMNVTK